MNTKYLCHQLECLVSTKNTVKMKVFLRADTESTYILKQNLHKGVLKTHIVWLMYSSSSISPISICRTTLVNSSKNENFLSISAWLFKILVLICMNKIYPARQSAQKASLIMPTKTGGVWAKIQKLVERWISS